MISVNSYQSLGAVDGPGVRFVVFLQGCNLKCKYCHNPETMPFKKENMVWCAADRYRGRHKDYKTVSDDDVCEFFEKED